MTLAIFLEIEIEIEILFVCEYFLAWGVVLGVERVHLLVLVLVLYVYVYVS